MTTKSSAFILAVLATCAGSTLLRINGLQGDYCTREYGTGTSRNLDWDNLPAGTYDCPKNPAITTATTSNPQRFPDSATTLLVSTGAALPITVVTAECFRSVVGTTVTCAPLARIAAVGVPATLSGSFGYVAPGADCGAAKTSIALPLAIPAQAFDDDDLPRKLCYTNAAGADIWTGFYISWSNPCTTPGEGSPQCAGNAVAPTTNIRAGRTFCCAPAGSNGICINNNVQQCCGSRAIERSLEKCCDGTSGTPALGISRYVWQTCPCNVDIACPTSQTCCQRTKFDGFNLVADNPLGTCFSNTSTWRCCNDGGVYNSGTHQCCSINGVQALDVPCPCGKNEDCLGGQTSTQQNKNMACCMQRYPTTPKYQTQCSAFTNYQTVTALNIPALGADQTDDYRLTTNIRAVRDSDIQQRPADEGFAPGRALPQFQRCLGQCINTTFEVCCNGARCYGQYERCCNQTCCNKYLSSCLEHNRGPARNRVSNANSFKETFAECTTIESMNALRAFWVYVVPTFLLVGSLTAFAIVVLFVINFTTRAYSLTEKGLLVVSVAALVLSLPTFFSPIYKYGLVGVVTALLCILSASARVKWLNVLALSFTLLFILYLFDPFHGNNYLNVASLRQSNGNPWTWSSGVIYSIRGIWPGNQQINNYCTQFYHGYFKIGARDFTRWTNPAVTTFGYCDRGWATALLVFQGLQLLVSAWLFVLALLLLLLRFRKSLYEQIELEIVHHDY